MPSRLIDALATTGALAEIFSDRSLLQAMLDFEAALARAEAKAGLVPESAAVAISAAALADDLDAPTIAREARSSGTLAIPLVKALTARVHAADAPSARFVHFGATSQDVADCAMVLTVRRALAVTGADHERLDRTLRELSERHARTVMLGRTLLQPAPPITFGLKVAGWAAALSRSWAQLVAAADDALVLQFGGAAGTLAALGEHAAAVTGALASELSLRTPAAPWHAHRDRLATLVCACGVYTGALGKMARDVALLMQDEVGEAREPGGGSSSMPHKRNPASCAIALAAATRLPGLVGNFLHGMVQEHERAVGGWHAEWPTIADAVQTMGSATAAMADAAGELFVDAERMRANLARTNGAVFAERAVMLMTPALGKDVASRLVDTALTRSRESGQPLRASLMAMPEVVKVIDAEALGRLDVPEQYLGAAEVMRVRLLGESAGLRKSSA
jgi:3-carboxy-cis,cis-muconate cycloisomerase